MENQRKAEYVARTRVGFEVETFLDEGKLGDVARIMQRGFKYGGDASIHPSRSSQTSIEWKSEPGYLHTVRDQLGLLDQVSSVLKVNQSCGVHVHVSIDKRDEYRLRTLINLVKLFYNNQSIIVKLCSPWRESSDYARLVKYEDIKELISSRTLLQFCKNVYTGYYDEQTIKYHVDNGSEMRNARKISRRYRALSLTPLLDLGTVEYRIFESTTDVQLLAFWIKLVYQLGLKAYTTQKVRIWRDSKIDGNRRHDLKVLWEFLRCIDMLDQFEYAKSVIRVPKRTRTVKPKAPVNVVESTTTEGAVTCAV
jgi:hypothetical protein